MSSPPCPICQKPQHPDYRPFCSRRCANVDLQRWLTGRYAIGGDAEDDGDSLESPGDGEGRAPKS